MTLRVPDTDDRLRGIKGNKGDIVICCGNQGNLARLAFVRLRVSLRRLAMSLFPPPELHSGQAPSPSAAGRGAPAEGEAPEGSRGRMSATAIRPTSMPSITTGTDCPALKTRGLP
jgi:hypothetical protein